MVDNRIRKLKGQPQKTRKRQILRTAACVKNLEELHEKYVLVPADKAANNVIVVCKQYYKEVLTKELTNISGASTYVRCNELADKVVESHLQFMSNNDLNVTEESCKLPSFYWMPKLHKSPYSHRFIAASSACTTKPLSKLLTLCLKLVLRHYKEYCAGIERRTGINCFWVINNSMEVLNGLHTIRRVSAIDSFDFSTLYTKIPHDQLKNRISKLINDAFTCRDAKHMEVHKTYACWNSGTCTSSNNAGVFCLTVQQVIDLSNYLIDNIYIQVGTVVFKQSVGIPMGTDCSPLI